MIPEPKEKEFRTTIIWPAEFKEEIIIKIYTQGYEPNGKITNLIASAHPNMKLMEAIKNHLDELFEAPSRRE